MELFLFLFAVMPGLYLYSQLRKEGFESEDDEPEYVVAIKGIISSMPLLAFIGWFVGLKFPQTEILAALKTMSLNYKYFGAYFVVILFYTRCAICIIRLWRQRIYPWVQKNISQISKKKAYDSGYPNAWTDIAKEYMNKYDSLVGRLLHDGQEITLGQISFLSMPSKKNQKEVGFVFQEEYKAYFPDGQKPLLRNLCNYVDFPTGYVLELYDGKDQIRK